MENSSKIEYFVLAAYSDMGQLKYLYFFILLLWYCSICAANTLLIAVIFADRRLREPMYMLLCNLLVNEISGSTSLYPLMLSQMFSEAHQVPLSWCFLQMSCMYTSVSVEFFSLAVMAYDRYVSICKPLHYSSIMSAGTVGVVVPLIWIFACANCLLTVVFVVNLKLCGNVIDKVFCDHQLVAKLACSVSKVNSIMDMFSFLIGVFPVGLIAVSYVKILLVCFDTSKENKQKAITTCTPQIVSVSNLLVGCAFVFFDSWNDAGHFSDEVRIFFSTYLIVCQPIITPFMYGFKLPKIREACKRMWKKKVFFLRESH
ncbi:olfactory receptor 2K2-like [Hippocampus zosterae]|uniref:olfactory receptor 2K2-like n=1 Tax=Hippocampus zosterae TaxID=109293 RepID=UPI00223D9CB0|nr:olfactory receptor 2K2-like [Hippocampus zosterae]